MLYFTFSELLKSIVFSALFGVGQGVFLVILTVFSGCLHGFFKIPIHIVAIVRDRNLKAFLETKLKFKDISSSVVRCVKDFVFTMFFGMSFILLLYVCCDGMFRFYMLVISVACFYLSYRYIGKRLEAVIFAATDILYKLLVLIFSMIIMPVLYVYLNVLVPFFKITKELFSKLAFNTKHFVNFFRKT